ncbi:MAG: AMP-binding protein [Myxococcota bacterium]
MRGAHLASVGRAVARTLRQEWAEGTLGRTLALSHRAGTLRFAAEPTYGELLERRAAEAPHRPYLTFEGGSLSHAQMNARADAVAAGLLRLGLRPGDVVSLLCPNVPAFLETFFATQKLGMGLVPVNTGLKGEGLRHVLGHSGSRAVVVHRRFLPQVAALGDRLPQLEHRVIVAEGDRTDVPREAPVLEDWYARHAAAGRPGVAPDPEAVSLLMYTSGTTGAPKGVVYRYRDTQTKRLRLLANLLYDPGEALFTCLPLFHANALLLAAVQALNVRGRLGLERRFSASRFWQQAAEHGATSFNALGAMIPILLKQPPGPHDRVHRVRTVVSAACPAHAWRPFEERFGVRLVEAYGAVDGGGFITMNLGQAPVGSIGRPLGGARYRLVGSNGEDVPVGQTGELLVWSGGTGPGVEYYRDEEATQAKTRRGWIHTGDLMYRDAKGFLYFAGRNTDSMRRRGENVSAFEVETVLDRHPDVLECAVFGVPSELGEEEIMAVVVPVEGRVPEPAALRAHAAEQLAAHAVPRYWEITDELPKTGTHRVQKSALKARGITARTWDAEAPGAKGGEPCETPTRA